MQDCKTLIGGEFSARRCVSREIWERMFPAPKGGLDEWLLRKVVWQTEEVGELRQCQCGFGEAADVICGQHMGGRRNREHRKRGMA